MQKHKDIEQSYFPYPPMYNQLQGVSCILNAHLLADCGAALVLGNVMFPKSKRRRVG